MSDADRQLLDQHSGWVEYLRYDETEDKFAIELVSDVEPILEANKREANDTGGYGSTREWRHIANIPLIVIEIWKKQYGVDPTKRGHEALLRRLLNDPDNRLLRISAGRF